jgi:hypothetical protein
VKQPTLLLGAWVGALVTSAVLALYYAAHAVFATPFPPFVVFDWFTRVLPGGVLTRGIDLMVRAIRAFGRGSTDTTAKAAEHTMAVAIFLVSGLICAAIAFGIFRVRPKAARVIGGIIGILLTIPLGFLVYEQQRAIGSGTIPTTMTASECSFGDWLLDGFTNGSLR